MLLLPAENSYMRMRNKIKTNRDKPSILSLLRGTFLENAYLFDGIGDRVYLIDDLLRFGLFVFDYIVHAWILGRQLTAFFLQSD